MSQHDYNIANASGSAVRVDINNALAAIVSNNSSSSEPSTKYAYMLWADTTNNILKIRNADNDGWVELLQLDGTLTMEDGAEATPGLAFRDDLNTGIWSSAADTFNISTGGTERLELGAATVFNESGADVDFRIEGDSDTNLFYVDAGNNRIGIGTASPANLLSLEDSAPVLSIRDTASYSAYSNGGKVYFQGKDSTGAVKTFAGVLGLSQSNDNGQLRLQTRTGGTLYDRLTLTALGNCGIGVTSSNSRLHVKGIDTTIGVHTYPQLTLETEATDGAANKGTGIMFLNHDGNGGKFGGGIRVLKENATVSNHASYMSFTTRPAGGSVTERLRILSTGGITFNGDTAAANALDDYEEGLYTATLTCLSSGTITVDSSFDQLAYTKIGRVVYVTGRISTSAISSPSGAQLRLNLPVVSVSGTEDSDRVTGFVYVQGATKNIQDYASMPTQGGNTYIQIGFADTGNSSADICATIDANTMISVNFHYFTA